VIDLLYLLVKYGYYANLDDIDKLMPSLLSLLNGKNDKPSIQADKEETKNFSEVCIIVFTSVILLLLRAYLIDGSF